jgi:4-hydroxyacetophenone monooxygenase
VNAKASVEPFRSASIEPIVEPDDFLARTLEHAELPSLLPSLAYLTGDLGLLRPELRIDPMLAGMPYAGLSSAQQQAIRALGLGALARFRDGGCRPAPPPSPDQLQRIMEFAVGGVEMSAYLPLLEEELALRGHDPRAPAFTRQALAPERAFHVLVIGAGMSGLLAGHRLAQAGFDFTIVDKNADVGGTWLDNSYPGCRVDNPNHSYSYSFAQRHDWPFHYSPQPVLLDYFRSCADAFGLRDRIQLGTEVLSARWSDERLLWSVRVRDASGLERELQAHAVISAVGQLNRPQLPEIEGRERFRGPAFHSARWDHAVDLRGKRVAVIGTGASAMQLIPAIAERCAELLVLQRTPAWLIPTLDYRAPVPDGLRWLYTHVPGYSAWHRFFIFWRMGDGALANVRVDPSWDASRGSVSAANDQVRQLLTLYHQAQFAARPELLPHVVPNYPPASKRVIRDDGVWAAALQRPNVKLLTQKIASIGERAIRLVDGAEHEVDVIVYATGFAASHFLTPMHVTGREGRDLHAQWNGTARAYLGIHVPGFPNLFCLYGPNTNIVINGSIIYFSECGMRHVLGCLRELLERRCAALDVRPEVHDAWNQRVDEQNARMAWGASGVNSWYKNAQGTVTQNWPFTLLEYWQRTLGPEPSEYMWLASAAPARP